MMSKHTLQADSTPDPVDLDWLRDQVAAGRMMTVVNYRWDETSDGYEFTTEWMVARIADGDGDGGYVDIPADAFDAASSKARRDDDSGIQFTVGGGGLWVESKIGCQKLATYR